MTIPFSKATNGNLGPSPPEAGPSRVLDQFQRPLREGDLILARGPLSDPFWRIAKMVPALEPNAPPNAVKITLMARVDLMVQAGMPVQEFVRVLTVAEQGGAVPPETPASPEKATTIITEP